MYLGILAPISLQKPSKEYFILKTPKGGIAPYLQTTFHSSRFKFPSTLAEVGIKRIQALIILPNL
jgi:hypothetical protein